MATYSVDIHDALNTAGDTIIVTADDENSAKTLALAGHPDDWVASFVEEITPA